MSDWQAAPIFGLDPYCRDTIVRPSAYVLIEGSSRQIALVHAPQGVFLPGGGIEEIESPEDAAVRECLEEAGLSVRIGAWRRTAIEYVYDRRVNPRAGYEKRSTFMDATVIGSPTLPAESGHELVWSEIPEAVLLLTPPSHRWAVEQWHARSHDERA